MNKTGIQWTHFTSNPLKYRNAEGKIVWGCIHKSEGCRHCYAEALAKRYGRGDAFTALAMSKLTPFVDVKEIRAILTSKKIAGKMVFIGDMTDIFGEWVPEELIAEVFNAMAERPNVTFQILTKRAERMRQILAGPKRHDLWTPKMWHRNVLPNVWLGVSVEDDSTLSRVDDLLRTPAEKRFVSYEPALGPVDFSAYLGWSAKNYKLNPILQSSLNALPDVPGLDQIIVGGESGAKARPFNVEWARDTVRQCREANVACFVKQMGSKPVNSDGSRFLVSREILASTGVAGIECEHGYDVCPKCDAEMIPLRSSHGSDPSEWPEDLRVQEWPR